MGAVVSFLVSILVGLASGPSLPDGAEELSALKTRLRSGDKWTRQGAVKKLAKLGTSEAWELVIEALDDDRGEVADTAQLLLAGLPGEELLEGLLGREGLSSRDEWVRRRAAEVVARVELPVNGEELARALGDRDPGVRRMLLWSLERLAGTARMEGDLAKRVVPAVARAAARDRDPGVRARALFALVALDPAGAEEPVRAAMGDREAAVRCAACALAPVAAEPEVALSRLRARAGDESIAVRTQVVDSLASLATAESVLLLIERLQEEKEARLGWRIVDHLQRVTGMKYRRDPRPWLRWAERMPDGWSPPREPAPREELRPDRSASFAGLPILSGRVAFLIDLSGSIWKERADGRTRKEVLDGKLRAALEGLPEETLFNVIPFTSRPHPWQKRLVRASPHNVRKAIRSFEDCRAQGTGNVWDAIMLAFEDPAVDTVVVLTDGAPTGGRRHLLELIVPLLEERNATRKIAVDSVLVDAPRKLQEHWADLARRTGGRSLAIEL